MATDVFASVVLGAALADGLERVADSLACFQIEIHELAAEHGFEVGEDG